MGDGAGDAPTPMRRLRQGAAATLVLLVAALILLGIARTGVIAADHALPVRAAAGIVLLAMPGPLLRAWDLPGQLLLWNAIGWCLALVALGLASVGATTIVPLVLLLVALSLWPRPDDAPPLWLPGAIALAGGAIAGIILWESGGGVLPGIG